MFSEECHMKFCLYPYSNPQPLPPSRTFWNENSQYVLQLFFILTLFIACYENFISHSVSMACKIYSFTFLLLALKCTKYPVLPHCRINSIHNYVLSWVRTYLRDDYISIVIKFGCVHHGRKVKQVLCWKCKQLQYLFQSLSVEAEKQ